MGLGEAFFERCAHTHTQIHNCPTALMCLSEGKRQKRQWENVLGDVRCPYDRESSSCERSFFGLTKMMVAPMCIPRRPWQPCVYVAVGMW